MKKILALNSAVFLFLLIICGSAGAKTTDKNKPDVEKEIFKNLGASWYEVTGTAGLQNQTLEEAKSNAEKNACIKAVQYHCGISIDSNLEKISITNNTGEPGLDDFFHISRQASRGIILEKKVLNSGLTENPPEAYVKLRVKVGKQKGEKDSGFRLQAKLTSKSLKNEEPIELSITSSADCHIAVLNLTENSVYVIFPNEYMPENKLIAGKTLVLPGKKGRERGITFPAILPDNKKKEAGLIKIIATRQVFPLTQPGVITEYGTYKLAYKKLMRQLVEIPVSQVEECDLAYTIER